MQLFVSPEAQAELLEAQMWYELRSRGLGFEFARAADAAVARALRMPLAHARMAAANGDRFTYACLNAERGASASVPHSVAATAASATQRLTY